MKTIPTAAPRFLHHISALSYRFLITYLGAWCISAYGQQSEAPTPSSASPSGFIRADGEQLRDGAGRPLVLRGVNLGNSLKAAPDHVGDIGRADFDRIHALGMNCVRLTIFWDGLEPQPGKIDADYIERIARLVQLAKERGIHVLIDMHQDLYSAKFGDGAPSWATLDEGKPYTRTTPWSAAYIQSEAVQTALDNFWNNAPAPDGKGLQEHYALAWKAVAQRFASEPGVLGYDLMNEPAIGKGIGLALAAGAKAADRPEAEWFLALSDPSSYSKAIAGLASVTKEFERTRLMPFYQRTARAVRQVDRQHLLVIEPQIMGGIGVPTGISPLTDAQGRRDPQQMYAPHAYDLNTDSGSVALADNNRIKAILDGHADEAHRLGMPLLIGEWGAYGSDLKAVVPARFIVGELDRLSCSDTYWSYDRTDMRGPVARVLQQRTDAVPKQ